MYYSLQGPGAALGLHMDERHEATKGHRGWETTDRRSVSWLLYLSGDGWGQPAGAGAGGHLRAYCRRCAAHVSCGAHEGDLQVGWLEGGGEAAAGGEAGEGSAADAPVFLTSWLRIEATAAERAVGGARWHARSALYVVPPAVPHSPDTAGSGGGREYLTPPFGADSPAWLAASGGGGGGACHGKGKADADADADAGAADDERAGAADEEEDVDNGDLGMSPEAFASALRAQLPCASQRAAFSGVEALPHPRQRVVEVAPAGGTLVLFDSVAVIHEVRHHSPRTHLYMPRSALLTNHLLTHLLTLHSLTHSLACACTLLAYLLGNVMHQVLPTDAGERVALAGWFHEAQQDFPEWHGE